MATISGRMPARRASGGFGVTAGAAATGAGFGSVTGVGTPVAMRVGTPVAMVPDACGTGCGVEGGVAGAGGGAEGAAAVVVLAISRGVAAADAIRSEEHQSEL